MKIHKGKKDKNFSWVARTICQFYGPKNCKFEYTNRWNKVTCKRCLAKK